MEIKMEKREPIPSTKAKEILLDGGAVYIKDTTENREYKVTIGQNGTQLVKQYPSGHKVAWYPTQEQFRSKVFYDSPGAVWYGN